MATERFCPDCFESFGQDVEFCPEHGKKLVVMDNLDDESLGKVGDEIDGRYIVTGILGRGGMGVVFKAKQKSVGREVALKVLKPIIARDATAVKRFFREARLASSLSHPNTVTVYDFARTDDGLMYISMELVEGQPLDELIKDEGPMPLDRALKIISYMTDSLGEAHQHGLVHRDLKPSNVIVQQRFGQSDFARVLDFGIAKSVESSNTDDSLTSTGSVCGSPAYMSPEQAMGKKLDGKSDVYSLGCILYEMLTGHAPFSGSSPMEVMMAHASKPFPTMEYHVLISEDLVNLLGDMTRKDPANRLDAVGLRNRLSQMGHGALAGESEANKAVLERREIATIETIGASANLEGVLPSAPATAKRRDPAVIDATISQIATAETKLGRTNPTDTMMAIDKAKKRPLGIYLGLGFVGLIVLAVFMGPVLFNNSPENADSKASTSSSNENGTSPTQTATHDTSNETSNVAAEQEAVTYRDGVSAAAMVPRPRRAIEHVSQQKVLTVTCQPQGATVWLDGEKQGTCPSAQVSFALQKKARLVVKHPGYKPHTATVDMNTPKAYTLRLRPKRKPTKVRKPRKRSGVQVF